MENGTWQVQATRNGQQVPTFFLPPLLGLTRAHAASAAALRVLGAPSDCVNGTIMNHDYVVYDLVTCVKLTKGD